MAKLPKLQNCCIISGQNIDFSKSVAKILGLELTDRTLQTFSDGEYNIQINESVRGKDVFILQSTYTPVNDNLMSVVLLADAARRALAKTVTVVMPYFGYARQDRMTIPRTPISAKVVASMFDAVGADHVVVLDLHSSQVQGFFNITVDNLNCDQIFTDYIKRNFKGRVGIVSPDVGGAKRARRIANLINCHDIILVDKMRPMANQSEVMNIIGNPEGKNLIIVDDMIDTGGTISKAAKALKDRGAESITVMATHPVFSGSALKNLNISEINEIVVTDTIPLVKTVNKVKQLSVNNLVATAIYRIESKNSR